MKKNILYIFDETADALRLVNSIKDEQGVLAILPMTTDFEAIGRTENLLQGNAKWEIKRLDFVGSFHKKAFKTKNDYISFISEFSRNNKIGKVNIRQYFKHPSRAFSLWWFSLLSEKNTLKSGSFHRLIQLLTFHDFYRQSFYQEIYIDIGDNLLIEAIKSNESNLGVSCHILGRYKKRREVISIISAVTFALKYFAVIIVRSLLIKLFLPGFGKRKRAFAKLKYLLVTYFPYLDDSKLKQGIFVNKYYEPLQADLKKKYPDSYVWLAMFVSKGSFSWKESVSLGRRINESDSTLIFWEEFLSIMDMAKVLLIYILFSIKYLFAFPKLSRNFIYKEGNIKVWKIFESDWHNSFCGYALIEGMFYYHAFRKVCKLLNNDAMVIYPAEMLIWEKALNIAFKEKPSIKTVGIQHTIVPLLLLMYFDDRKDLGDSNYLEYLPRPNYLATVGEIPRRLFTDAGWEKERVFSWGALRFQRHKRYLDNEMPWLNRKNKIIVATSTFPKDTQELLFYIYQAFKNENNFKVLIKHHPFLNIEDILAGLHIDLNNSIFTISNLPLENLLPDAKALITRGSSSALDALAFGCPVIIPKLARNVDMNPLSGISDLAVYVESPLELRETVRVILGQGPTASFREKSRDFIFDYYKFPESDGEFLEGLRRFFK